LQKIIKQNTQQLSDKNLELEETLRDLNEALNSLKENSIFKNRLIGLLGHDMLVPLRFIANISDHLYNDKDKLSPEMARESSGEIKNTAAELLYLGKSLIQWIKLEEGTFKLIVRNINIEELVNEIVMVHKPLAAVKNNHIVCKIPAHLSCTNDSMFIKVILHNLLLNANKFTSGGTIIIQTVVSDHCLTMHVEDTGIGMEPSIVTSLNNLMPVASQKGTDKETGWGMGYMLIIDLLRFANGKLHVQSVVGVGTKVSFSLSL
jgi:signal transduction histidine kinase